MYELVAVNKQGAGVCFKGRTMKEAQDKFDAVYTREGFKIYIRNDNGVMRIVKTTFGK